MSNTNDEFTSSRGYKIDSTYRLNRGKLFEVINQICTSPSQEDIPGEHGSHAIRLGSDGIELIGSAVHSNGQLRSCSVELGRIVNGKVTGDGDERDIYLQTYAVKKVDGKTVEKVEPNYLNILREFIA